MEVDKFTEGTLVIPFKIKNNPTDKVIATFPTSVTVTYRVGLKDYNKVTPNLFLIECDYQESVENKLNFMIPKVVSKPDFIKNLHINNQKIDFFIKK